MVNDTNDRQQPARCEEVVARHILHDLIPEPLSLGCGVSIDILSDRMENPTWYVGVYDGAGDWFGEVPTSINPMHMTTAEINELAEITAEYILHEYPWCIVGAEELARRIRMVLRAAVEGAPRSYPEIERENENENENEEERQMENTTSQKTEFPLIWEVTTKNGEILGSFYENTIPQELRDYVCEGERRRVYVQCTHHAPQWVYPPPAFPEPQLIGRGGIAINLVYRAGPEWRVGIYQKVGEVVFDRDPLRWPLPVERIADQIIACTDIIATRDEVAADVRRVLSAMRAKVPHAYQGIDDEEEEEDCLPLDLRPDQGEYDEEV